MSDTLHTPAGHSHGNTHSPIYQGLVATRCHHCPKTHKVMFSSDERDMVEAQVRSYVRVLRDAGYNPASIICESYHPGTDLNMREWQKVEALFEQQDVADIPF